MQNKDPNDYKSNPDVLLQLASHLGVTVILSDQPSQIITRVERVLQRIYAEVQSGRIAAPELLEAIGAQLAIVQDPTTIEELLAAHSVVCSAWRRRRDADDYSPINTLQHELLEECEVIMREMRYSWESRVERARHALNALEKATLRIADVAGIINRRALPKEHRIFISYAHEDKRIAEFIERRLSNGGLSIWRDDEALAGGSFLPAEILENIRNSSHFCVIVSPDAKKSRWVAQELSWALMSEIEHGSPKIIPILHGENKSPANLADDRRAISFDDWSGGISELWAAIGVPECAYWPLSEVGKLLRRGKRLLEAVEWCGQADAWMTIHEETFEELEEGESYLTGVGLKRLGYNLVRFARTCEVQVDNSAHAAYSEEFYKFANSYIAGTVLLDDIGNLIDELLVSIPQEENS